MIDLKTVLVDAFKEANLRPDYGSMELVGRPCLGAQSVIGTRTASSGYLGHAFDLDRLAKAITDHLTPKSVWIVETGDERPGSVFLSEDKARAYAATLKSYDCSGVSEWPLVDRLIEGLDGKAGS